MGLAYDDTDENVNLAEARSEVVHLDEDTVLGKGLGRGHQTDEDFLQLDQDMTLLVTIFDMGYRAARAVGRALLRQALEGPTAEYVNSEDLTHENWTLTASDETRRVAGAYFPASYCVR